MRSPKKPDTQDFKASPQTQVNRDPSYPDRERIDSDVRAFMRPVSTPWITFDRETKSDGELAFAAKAAMRAGVAFMSHPDLEPHVPAGPTGASRLAEINAMFPASVPQQAVSAAPVEEPSSLIVAADVVPTERHVAIASTPKPKRIGFIAATLGAVGVCSIAAYVVASMQLQPAPAAAPAVAAPPPPAVVEQPPAIAPPAPAPAPPADGALTVPASETQGRERARGGVGGRAPDNERWGKLTIKGDATKKQVWFDGKRMLGKGDRSFLVFCGPHTIAVNAKSDAQDTEVPCNGELVVDK